MKHEFLPFALLTICLTCTISLSLAQSTINPKSPDSADVVVIRYKMIPVLDNKGRPIDFGLDGKDYFYALWDHYIIVKHPSHTNQYVLYDTHLAQYSVCYPGENMIWYEPEDPYKLRFTDLKVQKELIDSIQGHEVFKCTARLGDNVLTAWHTDAFGQNFGFEELPGIPLYFEIPFLGHIVSVTTHSIDTQRMSTEFFYINNMEHMVSTHIPSEIFGNTAQSFRRKIEIGDGMRVLRGKTLMREKYVYKPDQSTPTVFIFFAAHPEIGKRFLQLNSLIEKYREHISFVAVTYDSVKRTKELLNNFPLNCPIIAHNPVDFARMGYQHNYYALVVDTHGYLQDVIIDYPQHLESRLLNVCSGL